LLGSALRGIDNGMELAAEVTDNPSEAAQPPPILQTDQATAIKSLETSAVAAELLTPAVIEGLVAVRRYEITTYGDRPPAETTQALRLAWSC